MIRLEGGAFAESDGKTAFHQGKAAVASFFARAVLSELSARRRIVESADNALMEVPESAF